MMREMRPHKTAPATSVFIPVYNRAHLVGRAIDSVLAQTFSDFELLVIDDGSRDDSVDMVKSYNDARIRLLENGVNKGIPITRQRGLDEARGRYFALLDSDDWMHPDRLTQQVDFLERNPSVACVGGAVQKYHPSGKPAGRLVRPCRPADIDVWLLFRNAFANTTLMGRTDILRHYGYRADFVVSEDYDLAARLAVDHSIANLPGVMTYMLEHDGRTTRGHSEQSLRTKSNIMKAQLDRLGVRYDGDDMARHYRLSRLKAADLEHWPDYLDWAEDWLARLVEANSDSEIYDPHAMRAVLGLIWVQTCLKARKRAGNGRTVMRILANAPTFGTMRLLGGQISARMRSTGRSMPLPPRYR